MLAIRGEDLGSVGIKEGRASERLPWGACLCVCVEVRVVGVEIRGAGGEAGPTERLPVGFKVPRFDRKQKELVSFLLYKMSSTSTIITTPLVWDSCDE